MNYIVTFLEGVISFISPCMLPVLPFYISIFAGDKEEKKNVFLNALLFVFGFTLVFLIYGIFAGSLGSFLQKYENVVNIICGLVVILLGLSYLDVIHIHLFCGHHHKAKTKGTVSAFVFGGIFALSHTPCLSAFLGSAVMTAACSGETGKGAMILLSYSLGLGLPFLLSAVLIDKLTGLFNAIKRNYKIINIICGVFLILVGVMMMFGWFHELIHLLEGGY